MGIQFYAPEVAHAYETLGHGYALPDRKQPQAGVLRSWLIDKSIFRVHWRSFMLLDCRHDVYQRIRETLE